MIEVTPAGQAVEVWAERIGQAPAFSSADLVAAFGLSGRPRLVIAGAHPDDETIGAGRLAHDWAQRIGPVSVVLATAGEACFDHVADRPAGLAEQRLAEWERALNALGVGERRCLQVPDGQVEAQRARLETELTAELEAGPTSTDAIVLAAPWRHDPHPDHRAVGEAAARVAAARRVPLLEFPIWMTYWTSPTTAEAESVSLSRLIVDAEADAAYDRACACFATQLEPYRAGWGAVVPPAMMAHHRRQLLLTGLAPLEGRRAR